MWTVNANGYLKPESFESIESALNEIELIFNTDRQEAAVQGDWSAIQCDHISLLKNDKVVAVSGLIEVDNGYDIALIAPKYTFENVALASKAIDELLCLNVQFKVTPLKGGRYEVEITNETSDRFYWNAVHYVLSDLVN
ncbi:hypothetical protein DDN26_14655 [Vibrio cholerae]|uniref:hypothetical protein n=1 Tax=Vibrio cholerae TaxID=666 RepID=UPI000E695A04|nr:hypothetical protein [Vibrio cholerae]EGR4421499.1 hypothetical protein [Vibrio cholerae]HCT5077585.1 hypothetical protein [Vibrio cholerae]